ncbi:MAG TPA: adenylate/guanylate cyclase domain-containing protein [Gaiellaceae bacterium]|nr:adenylate/guanylate cyclase domain-containing protein [Gaiellaceae bacterium]
MRDLPTGTVTLLFTDIEGSTKLLAELGAERYADVLEEHRRVLREAFARHGGIEIDTQGDTFFVAFAGAAGAAAAAEDAVALLEDGPVHVRIGIHTGEPVVRRGGYVGADVHRASRVMSAAHGGQVLASQTTRDLLVGLTARDLGVHRLKDVGELRLFQLGDGSFPPLRSLNNTNLPARLEPMLGRKKELAELLRLVLVEGLRLVTLTGPGGIGKTRLALELAAELVPHVEHGVWFVDLSPVREADLVAPTVSSAVGTKTPLVEHLSGREVVLVLDNFEQVVDAAPQVTRLLSASERLRVIVTSRESLHIAGEHEYPVRPLAEAPAVELLRQRANAAGRTNTDQYDELAELCRRLDNLPLAIELAAARAKTLGPQELLSRLDRRLPLLTKGRRDAPSRQRTLRATIEWSHELCSPPEQHLFRRLGVLAGGGTLEAAERVCDADLDTLDALVDKSLVRERDGRFSFLETIREYAHERLEQSDEHEQRAAAHAAYFLELFEHARPHVEGGPLQAEWIGRLTHENDNLRAALTWCERAGAVEELLRLATAAWWFWWARGALDEARVWMDRALAQSVEPTALRADALEGATFLAYRTGDLATARQLAEERLAIYRVLGDDVGLGKGLLNLANIVADDDAEYAERLWHESLELLGDHGHTRYVFSGLGATAHRQGEYERALSWHRRSLDVAHRVGDARMTVTTLGGIALVRLDAGQPAAAVDPLRECLQLGLELHESEALARNGLIASAVLLAERHPQASITLVAASVAALDRMHSVLMAFQRGRRDAALERARSSVPEAVAEKAWMDGTALDVEAASRFALAHLD